MFTEDIRSIRRLQKITFLILYGITAYYLLINGPGLFQNWDDSWVFTTLIYLVGVSFFLAMDEKIPVELGSGSINNKHSIWYIIIGFSGTFLLFLLTFWFLYDLGWYFQDVTPMPVKYFLPTALFQLVIVVCSETIIFQVILFKYFKNTLEKHKKSIPMISIVLSAFLFSLFHLAAYSLDVGSMFLAFVIGLFLVICVWKWNVGVAIGFHFVWNGMVLGLFAFV